MSHSTHGKLILLPAAPDPCSNGGLCRDGVDAFVCSCLPGFRGVRCQEDINECDSSPCKNGANCTDCVNSYTCTCPAGFNGINCEINANDCTERCVSVVESNTNLTVSALTWHFVRRSTVVLLDNV